MTYIIFLGQIVVQIHICQNEIYIKYEMNMHYVLNAKKSGQLI